MTDLGISGSGVFTPLRNRRFALYFTGQLLSQIGDGIYVVALPFLVLSRGGGSVDLGTVLGCYGLARLSVLQIGGTLADRYGARRVMLCSDALRAVVVLGLAGLATAAHVPLWPLIALAVPLGVLDGLFRPASFALVPDIVPDAELTAANALNTSMQSTALIVGPAIGGLLVAARSSSSALLIDALTFAASSLALYAIGGGTADTGHDEGADQPSADDAAAPPGWRAVLRYVRDSPLLRMALLVTVVVNLALGGLGEVVLPVFAIRPLDGGPSAFGLIMAGFGVGSVIGALLANAFMRLRKRGLAALVLGVAEGIAIMCVPLGSLLAVAVLGMCVAAVCQAVVNVFYVTTLQRDVPTGTMARVMSLMIACVYAAYPISVAVSGAIVRPLGPDIVIVAAGMCICAAFLLGFASKSYRSL
jgi:MFS family permease